MKDKKIRIAKVFMCRNTAKFNINRNREYYFWCPFPAVPGDYLLVMVKSGKMTRLSVAVVNEIYEFDKASQVLKSGMNPTMTAYHNMGNEEFLYQIEEASTMKRKFLNIYAMRDKKIKELQKRKNSRVLKNKTKKADILSSGNDPEDNIENKIVM